MELLSQEDVYSSSCASGKSCWRMPSKTFKASVKGSGHNWKWKVTSIGNLAHLDLSLCKQHDGCILVACSSELPGKIFSMRMSRLLFEKTEKGENSFETKTWQGNCFLVVLFCTNTAIVHFSFVDHITSFLGFSLFPWLCTFSSLFTLRIRGGSKPKWVQDHRKWSEQHDVPASWFLFRLPNHNTFCQVHIKENYWPYILVHWDEIGFGNLAREIASSCWSGGYKTRGAGGSLRFQ